ncbi:hypothetical protein T492DRAFT_188056 [Pavlovales sp. CCMP2436]|nr:hypothetical protein T492DRAFT_188056 [Pavlovales sp. CCMP2436]
MTVTSRNAVPMLPMQLARSFADRTECPVMRYLADAQFFGLEGLWQKLCAGQLPARCNKQWYFETFCGVSASKFSSRGLESLGPDAGIVDHLNGFVKPYDVLALMTVLPLTKTLFDKTAIRTVGGTRHLLLLSPEHTVAVSQVLNLLRETYHEVVYLARLNLNGPAIGAQRPGGRAEFIDASLRSSLKFFNAGE